MKPCNKGVIPFAIMFGTDSPYDCKKNFHPRKHRPLVRTVGTGIWILRDSQKSVTEFGVIGKKPYEMLDGKSYCLDCCLKEMPPPNTGSGFFL